MIKLIATDIDGTLIPEGAASPPAEMIEVLKKHLDRGTVIALASGRPLSALEPLFPELKDKLVYICSNGTRVVQNDRNIAFSPLIPGKALTSLLEAIRELHCDFIVDTDNISLVENQVSDKLCRLIQAAGIKINRVQDVTKSQNMLLKISIEHPRGPLALYDYPSIMRFREQYTLVPAGSFFLDVFSRNADKGTAVKAIQRQFGIKPEETVVFGNAMNDISLFGTTPNSYAVDTAPAEVKDCANYTISPPEEDGVLRFLNTLFDDPHM